MISEDSKTLIRYRLSQAEESLVDAQVLNMYEVTESLDEKAITEAQREAREFIQAIKDHLSGQGWI